MQKNETYGPDLHKIKKTVHTKKKNQTSHMVVKNNGKKSLCTKWLMIPETKVHEYDDISNIRVCTECHKEGRSSRKYLYVIHNQEIADYICFKCGEDVNIAYICITCRGQNKHNKC